MMEGWINEGRTIEGHLPGRTVSRKRARQLKHLVAARDRGDKSILGRTLEKHLCDGTIQF